MQWYDKLVFGGIVIGLCGYIMFVVGLSFMLSANRKARAEFHTSLQEARSALQQGTAK